MIIKSVSGSEMIMIIQVVGIYYVLLLISTGWAIVLVHGKGAISSRSLHCLLEASSAQVTPGMSFPSAGAERNLGQEDQLHPEFNVEERDRQSESEETFKSDSEGIYLNISKTQVMDPHATTMGPGEILDKGGTGVPPAGPSLRSKVPPAPEAPYDKKSSFMSL